MAKKSYFVHKDSIAGRINRRFGNPLPQKMIIEKIRGIPVNSFMKEPVGAAKKQLVTFITTAFSLTAALFWNDAIKAMITQYIPKDGTWPYLMVAAIIVTLIAVIVTLLISRTFGSE
ncbi:MAG: DUF5654 family protein [Candidatus Aenigmatarchaeota archaeon]